MIDPGAVLVPAALAGAVAIGATVAIERFGGRLGGILASMPTTIVPASIGIASASTTPSGYRDAMLAVPAGMLLNGFFLWLWRALPGRLPVRRLELRLALMVLLSLSAWFVGAVVVVQGGAAWRAAGLPIATLGLCTTALVIAAGVAACLRPLPAPRGTRRVGVATLIGRGLLAAAAIGLSVAVAATGQDLLAGIASVFPAIFMTTMVSLWVAQGEAVPVGAVGPMMLGSASVSVYALLASVLLPTLGAGPGAAAAWLGATATVSVPAGLWLYRRRHPSRSLLT